ncbi:argininosuccinate lyase [Ekhidna sp.]
MSKIWSKQEGQENESSSWLEEFTVGNDYLLDQHLLPYDIRGSLAHARGLLKINVLSKEEFDAIESALEKLLELDKTNGFPIEQRHEDMHTAIEEYLTEECGDAGKKIHTGRSRNDQVLCALRLYEKDQLDLASSAIEDLTKQFISFAEEYQWQPMPGYTHTQPAMVSSVGMWAASYAEMLISSKEIINFTQETIDYCPLGTAAGYGVNLDLPREEIAAELGFKAPMTISMTAQFSRGRWEASIVHAISTVTSILSQLASDLILFSSKEFGLFSISDELTTGSSIMPQKKNLDVAELMRAKHQQVIAEQHKLQQITSNLISGYHRDLQLTKEPIIIAFSTGQSMIRAASMLIKNLNINTDILESKIYPELYAADEAYELVKKGIPFREAYKEIGNNLDNLTMKDTSAHIKKSSHLGSTGNLGLEVLKKRLDK